MIPPELPKPDFSKCVIHGPFFEPPPPPQKKKDDTKISQDTSDSEISQDSSKIISDDPEPFEVCYDKGGYDTLLLGI